MCITQLGLNTLVTIVFGMLHSGTIKYLENPKWNCIIFPILGDTVPPALQMMK